MKPLNILLVEDDPDDSLLIKRALRTSSLPFKLDHMEDGEQAIEYLSQVMNGLNRAGLPDLLITDLEMPRCSGLELLQWIRSKDELMTLPVIMLSSTCDPRKINSAYSLGTIYCFQKPTEFHELVQLLISGNPHSTHEGTLPAQKW